MAAFVIIGGLFDNNTHLAMCFAEMNLYEAEELKIKTG